MSSPAQTKIFGIRLGFDPKFLLLGLVALAAALFWFNSRSGESASGSQGAAHPEAPSANPPATIVKSHAAVDRRRSLHDDRNTLRLRPVDAAQGDIDPMLRLDFLERLSNVSAPSGARNLFEIGAAANGTSGVPVRNIQVTAPVVAPTIPQYPQISTPAANIPYKYYGFAKPVNHGDGNRGFFMEGDNIFVAVEGQLLQQRYLVVQLTPTSARMEDTQVKLGQTLPLVPEASEQSGMGRAVQPEQNPMINQGLEENQ